MRVARNVLSRSPCTNYTRLHSCVYQVQTNDSTPERDASKRTRQMHVSSCNPFVFHRRIAEEQHAGPNEEWLRKEGTRSKPRQRPRIRPGSAPQSSNKPHHRQTSVNMCVGLHRVYIGGRAEESDGVLAQLQTLTAVEAKIAFSRNLPSRTHAGGTIMPPRYAHKPNCPGC